MNTLISKKYKAKMRPVAYAIAMVMAGATQAQVTSLSPIEVTGNTDGYNIKNISTGTRTDTPIEQVPQSVITVPKSMIEDQGSQSLSDALRNVSNVTALDQRDSNLTGFKIRGFSAATVVDGVPTPGVFHNQETLAGVEQISVIKGPAGGLFGGSQGMNYPTAGGTIAITTAEPEKVAIRQVGLTFGSYNQQGASFDINQPISPVLSVRLIGDYSNKDSETNRVYHKRMSLAPSIALTPNADTKVVLRLRSIQNETLDYPGLPRASTTAPDVIGGVPRSRFIGADGLPPSTNDISGANLQWSQKLNSNWDFGLTLAQNKLNLTEVGAFNASVIDSFLAMFMMPAAFGQATQDVYSYRMNQKFESTVLSPSVTGKFNWANTQHTVQLGVDHEESKEDSFMRWSDPMGFGLSPIAFGVNLAGATYATWIEPSGNSLFDSSYVRKFNATTSYVQDQVKIGDLSVLGSLRFNQLEIADTTTGVTTTRSAGKTTPRFGLTYAFAPKVSAFAGYAEAVQTPYLTRFASGVPPTAEDIKQSELGIRLTELSGITATIAAFDLQRKNAATSDGISNYLADQGSQGIDIDVRYQVSPSWQWVAAYTNQTTKYTGTVYAQVASYVGKQLFNVPKEQLRLATRYDFHTGSLQGLGLGLGVTHQSELPGDSTNSFFTSTTAVWDGQVSYQAKGARYGLGVSNLFDKQYLVPSNYFGGGQILPGAPRAMTATAVFTF